MPKAKILFHKCLQNAQELGSNNEFMVSRIFFSLQIQDKQIDDLYTDIKQTVGSKFEGDSLEVGPPKNFKGNIDYTSFRNSVEKYYRSLIGSTGAGVHVSGGAKIIMSNNWFITPMVAEVDIDSGTGGW